MLRPSESASWRWRRQFIRLILRRAHAHRLSNSTTWRGARLEGWGGPWFETPRTRQRTGYAPRFAAPHHEAGRGRNALTGIRANFRAPYIPPRSSEAAAARPPRFRRPIV